MLTLLIAVKNSTRIITIGTLLQEHDTNAESHLVDKIEKLGKIISLGHLAEILATNIMTTCHHFADTITTTVIL